MITDFAGTGDFYSGREVLASNGAMHEELLHIIHSFNP